MKYIVSILLSILIFTGCSNITKVDIPIYKKVGEKQKLISEANNGNIKAMVQLNKTYLFPETKEGFEYYKKWYKLVLKSDNYEDIMAFTKIFDKYYNMFINGNEKYKKLLNVAAKFNKEPLFKLLELNRYKKEKLQEIQDKILKNATRKDLNKLYFFYYKNYQIKKANRILELIHENSYKLSAEALFVKLKLSYYKMNEGEFEKVIEEIIKSNNVDFLIKTANFLSYKNKRDLAIKLLKKASNIDSKNPKAYFSLAYIYRLTRQNELRVKTLKKAVLLDNYDATKELLYLYYYDKKYKKDFLDLKEKLVKMNEAKRALADFYYSCSRKDKANKLYEQLANKGNINAIITLASNISYSIIDDDNLAKKWQNIILNTGNLYLISKTRNDRRLYNSKLKDFKEKLTKILLENNNIITIRELYKENSYRNKKLATKYLEKASKLGDVKSTLMLARKYAYSKDENKYKKAVSYFNSLYKAGDTIARFDLISLYKRLARNEKNREVAMKYYEKAYKLGGKYVKRNLALYYLCGECREDNSKTIDLEKADFYLNEIAKEKNSEKFFYRLGWKFANGQSVKKNLKIALMLYKIAAKKEYIHAYYAIAWVYNYELKDYKKCLKYLKQGINKFNDTNSLIMLGTLYLEGKGVKQDIEKAINIYKTLPNNKYTLYNLAWAYELKKDYKNAINYYEESFNKYSYKNSAIRLNEIYENGIGVKKDPKLAKIWLEKANNLKK